MAERTALNDRWLATKWAFFNGDRKGTEKMVDNHGMRRLPEKVGYYPELKAIHDAIFSGDYCATLPNGEDLFVNEYKNGVVRGIDYKGKRYLQQNPETQSAYASRAQKGEKIIWVLRNGEYIGRIDEGVVWMKPANPQAGKMRRG